MGAVVPCVFMAIGLSLRLVLPGEYPWGYHEDEAGMILAAMKHWCAGTLVGTAGPCNLQAPLFVLTIGLFGSRLGFALWSIIPIAIAALIGKSLSLRQESMVPAYAMFAAAPWGLISGRSLIGAEILAGSSLCVLALAWAFSDSE